MAEKWIDWYEYTEKQDDEASIMITEEYHSHDFESKELRLCL